MSCAGSIDEKIYQRQLMKGELASVMSAQSTGAKGGFAKEELRELFQPLDTGTACNTAELLSGSSGFPDCSASLVDVPLRGILPQGVISYVYLSPSASQTVVASAASPPAAEHPDTGAEACSPGPDRELDLRSEIEIGDAEDAVTADCSLGVQAEGSMDVGDASRKGSVAPMDGPSQLSVEQ